MNDREYIKQRMMSLRRQSGLNFNQDVFISILLCLMSSSSKHLILISPQRCLKNVTDMATEICRQLFGLGVTSVSCHKNQTVSEFVQDLLSQEGDTPYERSADTSDREGGMLQKHSSNLTSYPISPVDFTVHGHHSGTGNRYLSRYDDKKKGRLHTKVTSGAQRLSQVCIVDQLQLASELVQAALLDLVVTNEIRVAHARYSTPKPFLIILVLPENEFQGAISYPLLDQFFISYRCQEETFSPTLDLRESGGMSVRRAAHFKSHEIETLERQARSVYIHVDVTRYIRDIIVGLRTHPHVNGGLTARACDDLVKVTKLMAALFQQDYLTPDLVAVAVEKVIGHRLRVIPTSPEVDVHETIVNIVGDILKVVYSPV
ncbi:hypothetical protein DM01DRAFT_1334346 [Hesseltinella vesiculosa]|uniref:magnesium chelatase n=1 Tax=Hesseltinella vesiculosa TaxID=101127 RepID=A0A1X2GLW1_9FUNG|nr:hypothetical protein DM01DRAFT_1334346 [Hesseltinella vesiculosa]